MSAAALWLVRAGFGPVSFLELFWLAAGLACLKETTCMLLEARGQLLSTHHQADEVLRLLASIDYRAALQATLIQVLFVAAGVVAALSPPPPAPVREEDVLGDVLVIGFLVGVQVANLVGLRERRRIDRRIDALLRDAPRARPIPGGRREYDPRPGGDAA